MKAKDVTTHCVVMIKPDAPVLDAIARMVSHEIGGIPVVQGKALVGIVSRADLVSALARHLTAVRRWRRATNRSSEASSAR